MEELRMPTLVSQPTRIRSAGKKPKLIDEYIGRVNSDVSAVSVAHMRSPGGWEEPGQTPEFEEFTIVLKGMLRVKHKNGNLDVAAGQAVISHACPQTAMSPAPSSFGVHPCLRASVFP